MYNCFDIFSQSTRGAKTWVPDAEFLKQYESPIMVPPFEAEGTKWTLPIESVRYEPPVEKKVANLQLNFGPQHPAAHGVLRLVLELDGEVCKYVLSINCFS